MLKSKILPIRVKKAIYLNDYRIAISFNNGKQTTVDFKPFLDTINNGFLKKYKNTEHFKKFNIEDGNVVWGKDWDLIFPVTQLYSGHIQVQN